MQAIVSTSNTIPVPGTRVSGVSRCEFSNLRSKCGKVTSRTVPHNPAQNLYTPRHFPHIIPHAFPHKQGSSVAHIRKFRDGWRAEVQRKGVRKTALWPTRAAAKAWATKVEAEIAEGLLAGNKTFHAAVDRYLREVSAKKRGRRFEVLRLNHAATILTGNIADITQVDIVRWRDERLKTVSASTVLREATPLRHLFKLARKEWKWISGDPWDGVEFPQHDPPRHQRWEWHQIAQILRYLGYRHGQTPETKSQEVALAFMISLRVALRAGEVLQVGPSAIRRNVLTLRDTKTERHSQVPLTRRGAVLCGVVRKWTIDSASLDALFRKARDRCLIEDLRFQDARATALTLLARKVDVLTLSRISRHKDLKMLSTVYYRETAEEIARRLK